MDHTRAVWKYATDWVKAWYLVFQLGHGKVHPQISKTAPIVPKNKNMWQIFGIAEYYKRFVPS